MLRFACFILAISAAHGYRIVGGQNASIEEFPYTVSIEHQGKHLCGGSILSPTKVLTAAHCTKYYQLDELKVRAGSSLREQGGQLVTLKDKIEHPDYNNGLFSNDVGVLTLASALQLSDKVRPVEISSVEVSDNTVGYLTGWGSTSNSGSHVLPEQLQKLLVTKTSEQRCGDAYLWAFNPETMICFGGEEGESGCANDSGGPVVVNGKQVGVVSTGLQPCTGKYPILYAKLSHFKDLIESWM